MTLEIAHPLRLLAIPLCCALVFFVAHLQKCRSRKERVSHLLRHALVILSALAFAGVSVLTVSPDRTAWLLLDLSASANEQEVLSLADEALREAGEDRKTGVIVFGRHAAVEKSIGSSAAFQEIHATVDRSGSDLGEALALASALLPSDTNGGIAVIADPAVTGVEDYLASNPSVPVNTLQIAPKSGPDAQVTEIQVPATLYQGQKYTTLVTVHSNTASDATLLLSQNRETPETRKVTLRKGENTFAFESVADQAGVIPCEAQILLPGDTVSANNLAGAFAVVAGEMNVLLAEGQSGEGAELKKMLESAGMKVRVIPVSMLSEQASDLWAYHTVALVNADAASLTDGQIKALDEAVRTLGVGLAVFGGDASYALGGYRGSELEKLLPVSIDVKNKQDLPSTALVICIDKSGSMADESWGVSRLQLAREAAASALEVLNPRDSAGVIAFDDAGKWVVPLSPVSDVAAMQEQIRTIRLGGGTAFFSALKMAQEALQRVQAQYKHVIFLTDGEAGDTGYDEVVKEMAQQGITVTTVAVGEGADTAGMRKLAELGNGRMYYAGPFDSLPKIFTKETMRISGSYVQNRTFTPFVTDETMTDFEGFPPLDGYLATTEKPLATVSLASDRGDPLLAWWQYGAGKVAAWTSDVRGAWTASFLSWQEAPAFFGGIVSFVLRVQEPGGEATLEDGKLRFAAEAEEELLSRTAKAEAEILRPDGTKETVPLSQISANTFEGETDTAQAGAYSVHVTLWDRLGNELLSADSAAVLSWSREYDLRVNQSDSTEKESPSEGMLAKTSEQAEGILQRLSEQTGGQSLETAQGLLNFRDTSARKRRDLTWILALLAGFLFLFDVAQRRLDLLKEPEKKKTPATGGQESTAAEEQQTVPPGQEKATPKPKKKKTEKPQQEAPKEKATDVLWENLQKKKRL